MKVSVAVIGNFGAIKYYHEVEGEGDLSEAISIAIDHFRKDHPDQSVFDATIKVEKAEA